MVDILYEEDFQRAFSRLKHPMVKKQVLKLISRILEHPEIGKPMRNQRKGTREVYLGSQRLSYEYDTSRELIVFLDIYHKDEQ